MITFAQCLASLLGLPTGPRSRSLLESPISCTWRLVSAEADPKTASSTSLQGPLLPLCLLGAFHQLLSHATTFPGQGSSLEGPQALTLTTPCPVQHAILLLHVLTF